MKRALTREEFQEIVGKTRIMPSDAFKDFQRLAEHIRVVGLYAAPNTHGKVVKK